MKIRNNVEFEYFGLKINNRGAINLPFYVALDSDGEGFFYKDKPEQLPRGYSWKSCGSFIGAGFFDLEGKDWKETLVYVDEKGVTHYDV